LGFTTQYFSKVTNHLRFAMSTRNSNSAQHHPAPLSSYTIQLPTLSSTPPIKDGSQDPPPARTDTPPNPRRQAEPLNPKQHVEPPTENDWTVLRFEGGCLGTKEKLIKVVRVVRDCLGSGGVGGGGGGVGGNSFSASSTSLGGTASSSFKLSALGSSLLGGLDNAEEKPTR
jgi:uncharacterized membrane protein YgcG